MSENMNRVPGNGMYYLNNASRSRLSSFRGYLGQKLTSAAGYTTPPPSASSASSSTNLSEERQGWRAWAGEKARGLRNGGWRGSPGESDPSLENVETITLFPGWATRRYRKQHAGDEGSPRPFEVEVFTSGYAITHKNRENISRSQRAFIRVAKGFAALPKLTSESQTSLAVPEVSAPLSKSTEELLSHIHLPPKPEEVTEGYDMDALDRQFRRAAASGSSTPASGPQPGTSDVSPASSAASSSEDLASALKEAESRTAEMTTPQTPSLQGGAVAASELTADTLRRLHANLEERLQPFWSSVLPNRTVRLHLYVSPHHESQDTSTPRTPTPHQQQQQPGGSDVKDEHKPLSSVDVTTAADGSFQARFIVDWDQLCHHPTALQIAFGEEIEEHSLAVVAELLRPQPLYANTGAGAGVGDSQPYAQYRSLRQAQGQGKDRPTTKCQVQIPITHCPIRVISDIDDTVKDSGVLNGARAVFHNVFVKELSDCVVSGMGEWYTRMWSKGVRFHYVSNGPFEYLTVLNEFFALSQLPPGSIKLRSFAGRSLFNGFFSAPAARKRAGVEDILKAFPDSRFFLIGDSGEQDMELYAELAQKYPDNVLAIFIRDVTTQEGVTDPLDDPTGWNALVIQSALLELNDPPNASSPGNTSPSPRSRRSSVANRLVGAGKKSSSSLSSFLNLKSEARRDGVSDEMAGGSYFTTSTQQPTPLSAEPETYNNNNNDPSTAPVRRSGAAEAPEEGATPRLSAPGIMENSPTITQGMSSSSSSYPGGPTPKAAAGALNQNQETQARLKKRSIITDAPKPTSPLTLKAPAHGRRPSLAPSLSAKRLPKPSGSARAQRKGTTGSSASESDASVDISLTTTPSRRSSSAGAMLPGALVLPTSGVRPEERRRNELQMRVWRARMGVPGHVVVRVFRKPEECVEAGEILEGEGVGETKTVSEG
ncbi:hypothetical protein DFP72DRAFT_153242 [Ephemerocybe angulata]|uniref:Phosphatidate phosphatase APP1 catalytic domain-containing protein n=1 Tax=Ephemerocybe angulata TaxID=980116 RepID=A0A8H6LUC9_9AGAR|nr:hypothetical protein DFP72DRAFT_153242 [Tulosesus angulatus]